MAAPIITPIPTPPIRSDAPADFALKADAFAAALPQFVTQTNNSAAFVDQRTIAADSSATAAAASEAAASASQAAASASEGAAAASATEAGAQAAAAAGSASAAADSAAASAGSAANSAASASDSAASAQVALDAAASIADGPVASVNGKTGIVLLEPADIAPIATQAEMQAGTEAGIRSMSPQRVAQAISALAGITLLRSARASNAMLTAADKGQLIDITSGTFTQTFAAAATLGDGWWCYLKNSGKEFVDVPVNGTFDTDTGWTKSAGWTISGGSARAEAANGNLRATPDPLITGRKYKATCTVTVTSGRLTLFPGHGPNPIAGSSGVYAHEFIASSAPLIFQGASFTGSLDNVVVQELASADITLAPNTSELIDGLTSFIMYPGEVRLVQCDGVALRSVVLNSFYRAFTASGNFMKPPGYAAFGILGWPGGSGGGGGSRSSSGAGGAGATGIPPVTIPSMNVAESTTVTVGAGGVGGNGGATSPSSTPGVGGTTSLGGVYSTASLSFSGTGLTGGTGGGTTTGVAYGGGDSLVGGGGGGGGGGQPGTGPGYAGGVGGVSAWSGAGGVGGVGGDSNTNAGMTAGNTGIAPGGGGGGGGKAGGSSGANGANGGNGARGELRIWGII